MIRKSFWVPGLLAALAAGHFAMADDMESLFDDASDG